MQRQRIRPWYLYNIFGLFLFFLSYKSISLFFILLLVPEPLPGLCAFVPFKRKEKKTLFLFVTEF